MSTIALDLQTTLKELAPDSAIKLERLVRDAIALARPARKPDDQGVDANGWPIGYFERTAGCFADQPFEAPDDPPPEPLKEW